MGYFFSIHSELADYDHLDDEEVGALVDAVVLAMVAEGEVPEEEESELARLTSALDDCASMSVKTVVRERTEAAREVVGDEEAYREWARDVAERLDDQTLLEEAYYLASRMAAMDVDVVADETAVLGTYVDVFDFPRDRLKRLTQRLREHT